MIPKREQFLMSKFNVKLLNFFKDFAIENGLPEFESEEWAKKQSIEVGLDLAKKIINNVDSNVMLFEGKEYM